MIWFSITVVIMILLSMIPFKCSITYYTLKGDERSVIGFSKVRVTVWTVPKTQDPVRIEEINYVIISVKAPSVGKIECICLEVV